jgi:hypothetical protein
MGAAWRNVQVRTSYPQYDWISYIHTLYASACTQNCKYWAIHSSDNKARQQKGLPLQNYLYTQIFIDSIMASFGYGTHIRVLYFSVSSSISVMMTLSPLSSLILARAPGWLSSRRRCWWHIRVLLCNGTLVHVVTVPASVSFQTALCHP